MSSADFHAPENQPERERERRTWGPKSKWNKGAVLNFVWVHMPCYKVASSDKDQKARLYKLPRKQGVIEAIKPKDNPYQKRVVNNPFHHMERLMNKILCMHCISLISVLGAVCHSTRSWPELIRNRGLMRDRKQHTGILLLNIPWQSALSVFLSTYLYQLLKHSVCSLSLWWFLG